MADNQPPNMPPSGSNERDLLAAEYAFGFAEEEARLQAEQLIAQDADFAALVSEWTERASAELLDLPGEGPQRDLFPDIERKLQAPLAQTGSEQVAANDNRGDAAGWKFATLAASVAALAFAGLWQFDRPDPVVRNRIVEVERPVDLGETISVAQITGSESEILLSGVYNRDTGALTLRVPDIPQGELVPEVWVIGEGAAPRSLGFADRDGTVTLQLSPELRNAMVEGSAIAVSLEEPSSQPHEAPTPDRILGATPLVPLTGA
ncbi:hypothetical protein G7A66_04730 [Altererythrobacter sp. SALINAS58]|uniref:anti-sigma factor n=1 Tax=Alteripontixanthobacter muriae TaxID=2705546 RepID=UPI00157539FF|nr:anti-sigma factor [Alteripontixanthobacter muriae]NTZ42405.1 hypothetical protein [Alteripontixanthobacter muriae]